jgi:O-acetyl-ADP-ribose deacetylase (regulator of RNase III)
MADIEVVIGDITTLNVDVIVNAANEGLLAGGGVCGAIFAAAGADELSAACAELGRCPTGSAVVTDSCGLRSVGIKYIVHAVGPIWRIADEESDEARLLDEQLAGAYRESLSLAESVGAGSIAFPAISTGIYGFPAERASAIAVGVCREFKGAIDRILLVAFDESSAAIMRNGVPEV